MKTNNQSKHLFTRESVMSLFCIVVFILSPSIVFILNLFNNGRYYVYGTIALSVFLFMIIDQVSVFNKIFRRDNKNIISISLLHLVVIGLISLTGNFLSPFFWGVYVVIVIISISLSKSYIWGELLITLLYLGLLEFYQKQSLDIFFDKTNYIPIANLGSLFILSIILSNVSDYIFRLRIKEQTLIDLRLAVAEDEKEDEALLTEIQDGIIILDESLNVVKISQEAEKLLGITPELLLGHDFFNKVKFLDPVTKLEFTENSDFVRNLKSTLPTDLKWNLLYKGIFKDIRSFSVEQKPLYDSKRQFDGFLLRINTKKQENVLSDVINSFNEYLYIRFSSVISFLNIRIGHKDAVASNYLKLFIDLLNDANMFTKISQNSIKVNIARFSLRRIIYDITKEVSIETQIFPLTENDMIEVESEQKLLIVVIKRLIEGMRSISSDKVARLKLVSSENVISLQVFANNPILTEEEYKKLTKPFYQLDFAMQNKLKDTGLEFAVVEGLLNLMSIKHSQQLVQQQFTYDIEFPVPSELTSGVS